MSRLTWFLFGMGFMNLVLFSRRRLHEGGMTVKRVLIYNAVAAAACGMLVFGILR